jgi:NACalpha-BTF3-like transcription factor
MGNTRVAQNSNAKSYSCVAATPADERRLEMARQQRLQQQTAKVEAQKKATTWADEEDSEDEVYESEEEEVKVVVSQYGSSAYFQPTAPSSYSYLPRATAEDDDW